MSLILMTALVTTASAVEPAAEVPTVPAVNQTLQIEFHFQSFSTFYSCDALEDRVEQVLLALGNVRDIRVTTSGCPVGGVAYLPHVRISLTVPVEATPQVLADLEKTRSTRELTARVRGERPPDIAEQFSAYWRPVSLTRGRKLRLEPGDCALLDQLKRHVFPRMGVKVVKDNLTCSARDPMRGQVRMEIEALTAVAENPADEAAPAAEPAGK